LYFTHQCGTLQLAEVLSLPKSIAMTEKTVHEGRNVKRIREMPGIKQDALAMDLGLSHPSEHQSSAFSF